PQAIDLADGLGLPADGIVMSGRQGGPHPFGGHHREPECIIVGGIGLVVITSKATDSSDPATCREDSNELAFPGWQEQLDQDAHAEAWLLEKEGREGGEWGLCLYGPRPRTGGESRASRGLDAGRQ